MTTKEETKTNVKFMSVASFKEALGVSKLEIKARETESGVVYSVYCEELDKFFRAQGNLDTNKPMKFIMETNFRGDADLENACLVNVSESSMKTIATL